MLSAVPAQGTKVPENQSQETFTISLSGSGIDIKREVSANKLAAVMSVIMGPDTPEASPARAPVDGGSAGLTKLSLREFLDSVKATTKPDQIVAIGQYMAAHERKDTFSRDDIKVRFQSARERLPSNFPRDFSTAIGKGLIAEDHAKTGQYYVTSKGMQAVETRFGA
jgi:hypothetical protein